MIYNSDDHQKELEHPEWDSWRSRLERRYPKDWAPAISDRPRKWQILLMRATVCLLAIGLFTAIAMGLVAYFTQLR